MGNAISMIFATIVSTDFLLFQSCVLNWVLLDVFSNDLDTSIDEALAQVETWFLQKCVVFLYVLSSRVFPLI